MSVAIRTITRLQDGDDAPAMGAGQNVAGAQDSPSEQSS